MILIIDNENNLRMLLEKWLKKNNFQVIAAKNFLEALEVLNKNLPDLIIFDIKMSGIDGFQFLTFLRDNPKLYYIPVIILTAKTSTHDKIRAYSLGCNAYLSKPFSIDELIYIIKNLVTLKNNYITDLGSISDFQNISNFNQVTTKSSNLSVELTPKEQRILNLISLGHMNKEISKKLNISLRNTERYVSRLFRHFEVNNRTELVQLALKKQFTTN